MTVPARNLAELDEAIDQVSAWLDTKGITLWGDYMITDPNSKRAAAKWFITQMDEFFVWWDKEVAGTEADRG